MAISQFPGVGPTNTDVASAVVTAGTAAGFAATGPTTTQIAAAVPTLAQITTAITSNAASAGVTMAAITSSITANAASAGVTLAAIGSQVSANASPYGGTWTNLGTYSSGGASATFSNLGGYKYLKFFCMVQGFSSTDTLGIRFNGENTGSNYWSYYAANNGASATNGGAGGVNGMPLGPSGSGIVMIEIFGSNSTIPKAFKWNYVTTTDRAGNGAGVWLNTAAITSVTLYPINGSNFSSPMIVGIGAV